MTVEHNYKVLVTTSGVGSRLGDFTTYTNKALINVGDKPAISWIVESYSPSVPIVVTLGHFGTHVREYLAVAYPHRKFEFVEVENFKGSGSSLANSMFQAKMNLQCPFIFHASDTIVQNFEIPEPTENWIASSYSRESNNYSSLNQHMGLVTTFHPKGWSDYDALHIGLVGIKDFQEFWEALTDLLREFPNSSESNDVSVIEKMIAQGIAFRNQPISNWIDTGNLDSLIKGKDLTPSKYFILEKKGESIYFVNRDVIKFFADPEVCAKRIERAAILAPITPPIERKGAHFYSYKFLEGSVLSEDIQQGSVTSLLKWADSSLWSKEKTIEDNKFNQLCEEFYFQKTLKRAQEFFLKSGLSDQEQRINGVIVPKLGSLLEHSRENLVVNGIQSGFHGDFILDNLIQTNQGIRVIDWRQDFAGSLETGDLYYDLAKLNHSFYVSHKAVINNSFKIEYKESNKLDVSVDIFRSQSLVNAENELFKFAESRGYSENRIRLLTSIVWLNMSPLHHHPFDLFLFYFGKLHLLNALG